MKIKKCPFCEGEISSTAKKCKHCGEWINGSNYENGEVVSKPVKKVAKPKTTKKVAKTTKKTLKKIKKTDDGPKQSKISKFISDNLVLVIIGAIIIFFVVKSFFNNTDDQGSNIENDIDESTEVTENLDNIYTKYQIKGGHNITPTDNGYILFKDKIGECEIKGESEITNFVGLIKNTKDGEIIKTEDGGNWECPRGVIMESDVSNGKKVAILFDNSYSKDQNGNIDKSGPDQRMSSLKNYFNENDLPNGSTIDIVYMFTIIPPDNSEEPDGNIYKFKIDSSVFPINYIKDSGGDNAKYFTGRYYLKFEDTIISYSFSGINKNDIKCMNDAVSNEYTCYDAESVYQEIQDIYSKTYDREDKHTNNMFIKTLFLNKDRFSGVDKDEIFIFTSGEFKVGEEYEKEHLTKLKQKYKNQRRHDQGVDKTHNLSEFNMRYANRYQKDSKYESFWSEAIEALRPKLPVCNGVDIYVIGLTRSAEFKPLAEKIYKQIFEPCEVIFK